MRFWRSRKVLLHDTYGRLLSTTASTGASGSYDKLFTSALTYDGLSRIASSSISGTHRVEDTDSVTYAGTWVAETGSLQSGCDYHYSSVAGATATKTLTSSTLTVIGMKGPVYGRCEVFIDGVSEGVIDCYAADYSYQVPLLTKAGLSGSHTIQVKVLGTKNAASSGTTVVFDAFEVTSLPTCSDSFTYDEADRLTGWERAGSGATEATYGYDAAGNLTTVTVDAQVTSFTYDADDRLTNSTSGSVETTFTNDAYGRRTSEVVSDDGGETSDTTSYSWDAMGHLTSVVSEDATSTYSYGATGMREYASVTQGGTTTWTRSFWLGSTLTAELDSDGTRYDYLWRPDGTPLALSVTPQGQGASVYHYQTDAHGSVVAITDASGDVVASYTYGAYGEVLSVTGGTLADRNPLRYRGYHHDTTTGLYYLPARYYDPATCRFLSPDPASPSAGDPLTLNAYAYCVGDPVNLEDPSVAIMSDVWEAWSRHYGPLSRFRSATARSAAHERANQVRSTLKAQQNGAGAAKAHAAAQVRVDVAFAAFSAELQSDPYYGLSERAIIAGAFQCVLKAWGSALAYGGAAVLIIGTAGTATPIIVALGTGGTVAGAITSSLSAGVAAYRYYGAHDPRYSLEQCQGDMVVSAASAAFAGGALGIGRVSGLSVTESFTSSGAVSTGCSSVPSEVWGSWSSAHYGN